MSSPPCSAGNLVRLVRLHGRHGPGTNWAGEGSAMAQLQYNLYNESDYSIIWDHYAYIHPGERLCKLHFRSFT